MARFAAAILARRRGLALVFLLLVLHGAEARPQDALRVTPPTLFGSSPTVVLGDRDSGLVFGRVADIAIGPRGDVYVLDSGFAVVHHFRGPEEYVGTFGRSGEGPGEFTIPMSIAVDPRDGNVWVGNLHGRLCEYTSDGSVVDDIRFSWPGSRTVRSIAVGPGGNLYVVSPNVVDQTMMHVFSQEGELLRSFGPTYAIGHPEVETEDEMTYAQGFLDLRDDTLFYAQKNPLEIRIYESTGELSGTITDPGLGVPFPPKVRQLDGRRIKSSLEGTWGIVALPKSGFIVNVVVPVSEDLPIGGSIVVEFDDAGTVVERQEFETTLFVAEAEPDGAIWAFDNEPFSRVMRYPKSERRAP